MRNDRLSVVPEVSFADVGELMREAAKRTWEAKQEAKEPPLAYRVALGREPLQLGIIEFRILLFLAGKPYHPFTRRRIATAINSERHPVSEETVDQHITSLRDQLGPFRDYIQSVPYIGYRFKA